MSNSTVWLKFNGGLPAGTTSVYMHFLQTQDQALNIQNIGEAPQFSGTYGEYDDGANVFNFYDAFGGTNLDANKWVVESGTPLVSNGLSLSPSPTYIASVTTFNPQTQILDAYAYFSSGTNWEPQIAYDANQGGATPQYLITGVSGPAYGVLAFDGTAVATTMEGGSFSSYQILSLWSGTSSIYGQINYGMIYTNSASFAASTSQYIFLGGADYHIYIRWIRVRAYPPNGIMPSATFGSVQ